MVFNLQLLLHLALPVLLPFLTEFDLVLHELQCILKCLSALCWETLHYGLVTIREAESFPECS